MANAVGTAVGSLVALIAASGAVHAGGAAGETPEPPPLIILLPGGFKGWACVDFGVAGAPPLPREGDALIVRPRPGEVLQTSDQHGRHGLSGETWIEVDGLRRPLPEDAGSQRMAGRWDTKDPVERQCAFFGTIDEADAAGDAPGIEGPPGEKLPVPPEEREALVAFYQSTGGGHWTHHVGWLGPPGTECRWHGVQCSFDYRRPPTVSALNLHENNLVGPVPEALGRLTQLDSLLLYGNRLTGHLPDPLLTRWLAGPLSLSVDASLLTDVSEISLDWNAYSILCARHRITLFSDGTARRMETRCRNASPDDRETFCEVKEGRVWRDFARLGVLIERNKFTDLREKYNRNVIDSLIETTSVVQNGKRHVVSDDGGSGPFELWAINAAIEGVAATAHWEKTTTQPACPWGDE